MTEIIVHTVIHFVALSNLVFDQLFILQSTEPLHHLVFTAEHIPLTNPRHVQSIGRYILHPNAKWTL